MSIFLTSSAIDMLGAFVDLLRRLAHTRHCAAHFDCPVGGQAGIFFRVDDSVVI